MIDLGDTYLVDGLNVWHYHGTEGGRNWTYRDLIYQLSTTADFTSDVTTVFNNDANNSALQGIGSDPEYEETPAGRPVYFAPVRARYLRLWSNGSTRNTSNRYTDVQVYGKKNLAAGIAPTTGGASANSARATDGMYSGSGQNWDVGTGKKYVQFDLGSSQLVDSLRVWHYFGDRRRYHDVIFQLSDDAMFSTGVTTVFNNDLDNSAGKGAGKDGEYDETATGKIVHFAPVFARYVRFVFQWQTR